MDQSVLHASPSTQHFRKATPAYLVPARTGPETLVCEVKLFHAERTRLLLIVVDELILLCA